MFRERLSDMFVISSKKMCEARERQREKTKEIRTGKERKRRGRRHKSKEARRGKSLKGEGGLRIKRQKKRREAKRRTHKQTDCANQIRMKQGSII